MNAIYKPKGMAAEYAEHAINIYSGCNHGCDYCYMRPKHERFKGSGSFSKVEHSEGLIEKVQRQLASGKYAGKLIHLCFSCDPYPEPPVDTTPTREIVKLLKLYGCHVQVLTKGGHRAERDFDLLDRNDWFGVTISGNEVKEPGAAPELERIVSLWKANRLGIKTWISLEPVYDEKKVYSTIKDAEWVDLLRIGKLNHHPSSIDWGSFGRECERCCKKYGRNYQIKDELRREMDKHAAD